MKSLLLVFISTILLLVACTQPADLVPPPTPTLVASLDGAPGAGTEQPDQTAEADGNAEAVAPTTATAATATATAATATATGGAGRGMMGGMMGGGMGGGDMHARHMAPIPAEYAGLTSSVPADAASLRRGAAAYALYCASCHGPNGQGDGPAAAALDPAPPMIAMTSQMMGDDYLFWRISEGGALPPFNSAMPSWKASVDETTRWDLINYVRVLGQGETGMAGEGTMRAEMLAAGQEQGIISAEEAARFEAVHALIDARFAAAGDRQFTGNMEEIQNTLLQELVDAGEVAAADADAFYAIHDRLVDAGLMQ